MPHDGFSANVKLALILADGRRPQVAQVGPDSIMLRERIAIRPGAATLQIVVDDELDESTIFIENSGESVNELRCFSLRHTCGPFARPAERSPHQLAVDAFMRQAGQELPPAPTGAVSEQVRMLRAKLILEEALETIVALGVSVCLPLDRLQGIEGSLPVAMPGVEFAICDPLDLVEVVDGCCDLAVVATGTLSALGVADVATQAEVNLSNLAKFGPGGQRRADGKWIKPPNWQPPKLAQILDQQRMSQRHMSQRPLADGPQSTHRQ